MRLLDTETGQFIEIVDTNQVEYAILSHTWDPKGEQSYQELREIQRSYAVETRRPPIAPLSASSTRIRTPPTNLPNGLEGPSMSTTPQTSPSSSRKVSKTSLFLQRIGGHNRSDSSLSAHDAIPTEHTGLSIWDDPRLSKKIRQACAIARAYGHRLLWIDSCCIDKTSSSELSEAINSMFQWYRDASVCYAFLADVPPGEDPQDEDSRFRSSRWFTRGWTLQELIAPRVVIFLSQGWHFLGAKSSMVDLVEDVTGIDRGILTHDMRLDQVSVARRMSWASRRITTRMEDEAYALLGLFDISMSTIYGEGRRAFVRLQQAIMMQIPDQSLFAWATAHHTLPVSLPFADSAPQVGFEEVYGGKCATLFADAPWRFYTSKLTRPLPYTEFIERLGISTSEFAPPRYSTTPYGVETHFPLIPVTQVIPESAIAGSSENWYFAVLACESSHKRELIAIACTVKEHPQTGVLVMRGGGLEYQESQHIVGYRLVGLSPDKIDPEKRWHPEVKTLYVPLENPRDTTSRFMISTLAARKQNPVIRLAKWSAKTLRESGCVVTREQSEPTNLCFSISKGGDLVKITLPAAPRLEYLSGNVPITVEITHPSSEGATYNKTQTLEFIQETADFLFRSSEGEDVNMRIMLHNTTGPLFYLDVEMLPQYRADTDGTSDTSSTSSAPSVVDSDAQTEEDENYGEEREGRDGSGWTSDEGERGEKGERAIIKIESESRSETTGT